MHQLASKIYKPHTQVSLAQAQIRRRPKFSRKQARYFLVIFIASIISFALSLTVYASSYELLFNKDLPIVAAIGEWSESKTLQRLAGDKNSLNQQLTEYVGDNGEPQELRIPKASAKIALLPALQESDGNFLTRSATGHFLFTSTSRSGGLGNAVMYMRREWRSLANNVEINIDDNVFVDTRKDWRYMYRITEVQRNEAARNYVAATSSRASLIILMQDGDQLELYRGELISLQSIQK